MTVERFSRGDWVIRERKKKRATRLNHKTVRRSKLDIEGLHLELFVYEKETMVAAIAGAYT